MISTAFVMVAILAVCTFAEPIRKRRQAGPPGRPSGPQAGPPGRPGASPRMPPARFNQMFNMLNMYNMMEGDMFMGGCGSRRTFAERSYLAMEEGPADPGNNEFPMGLMGMHSVFCRCEPMGACESTVLPSGSRDCGGPTVPTMAMMSPFVCCCGSKKK